MGRRVSYKIEEAESAKRKGELRKAGDSVCLYVSLGPAKPDDAAAAAKCPSPVTQLWFYHKQDRSTVQVSNFSSLRATDNELYRHSSGLEGATRIVKSDCFSGSHC